MTLKSPLRLRWIANFKVQTHLKMWSAVSKLWSWACTLNLNSLKWMTDLESGFKSNILPKAIQNRLGQEPHVDGCYRSVLEVP